MLPVATHLREIFCGLVAVVTGFGILGLPASDEPKVQSDIRSLGISVPIQRRFSGKIKDK